LIFFLFFIITPLLLILYYAFTDKATGALSFNNLISFVSDKTNIDVLVISLVFAFGNTLICLLIGYPIAYILARLVKNQVLVLLFIIPMWINFVLRTGATRDLLTWMGINGGTSPYLATLVGMVYNYLPFVILPLYTTMLKLDKYQIEAAQDLGASPVVVFFKNILLQLMIKG
jgi:spermidine/putrescine transport system permease protein